MPPSAHVRHQTARRVRAYYGAGAGRGSWPVRRGWRQPHGSTIKKGQSPRDKRQRHRGNVSGRISPGNGLAGLEYRADGLSSRWGCSDSQESGVGRGGGRSERLGGVARGRSGRKHRLSKISARICAIARPGRPIPPDIWIPPWLFGYSQPAETLAKLRQRATIYTGLGDGHDADGFAGDLGSCRCGDGCPGCCGRSCGPALGQGAGSDDRAGL